MKPYYELANAIVAKAVEDYIKENGLYQGE